MKLSSMTTFTLILFVKTFKWTVGYIPDCALFLLQITRNACRVRTAVVAEIVNKVVVWTLTL